jgi:hypothetical protein
MEDCNILHFHFCPETLVFTVKGEDLNTISQIYSELGLQDLRRSFRPRNSYIKPFLPELPDGQNGMRRSKDLSGVGTLTVQCTNLTCYFDVFIVVSDAFYVTCNPGQKFVGTIAGMRKKGPMASALVSSYIWPISDGSPDATSAAEATEFSKLGI